MENKKYCESLTSYQRFKTRTVSLGSLKIGGNAPIVIQSMTTTDTMDTDATVAQTIRMIQVGCELVRITAPSVKEAQNLAQIKQVLRAKNYSTPLVADIHFTPNAAEIAAKIVEKVRINPGNYTDKKKFETFEYTAETYAQELEKIKEKLLPLIQICKENKTVLRIGTNHGSLSDRIMSKYGDTPAGMVASAMEFIEICRAEGFDELVLSMKASNPKIMVQAYRLLVHKMMRKNMNYPIHLGVTEAGEGEDGRIKSAIGIGVLLEDGIGDTIRVSLTEEPEAEIPVAKMLLEDYPRKNTLPIPIVTNNPIDPFSYKIRETDTHENIGGKNTPVVLVDLSQMENIQQANLYALGYQYSVPLDKWHIQDQACDYIFVDDKAISFEIPGTLGIIQNHKKWLSNKEKKQHFPLISLEELSEIKIYSKTLNFIAITVEELCENIENIDELNKKHPIVLILHTFNNNRYQALRSAFVLLLNRSIHVPVIVKIVAFEDTIETSSEKQIISCSRDLGGLLIDGLGNGVMIESSKLSKKQNNSLCFGILQATRTRISKTEYISCPSCGRTLFDLQSTTSKIRAQTHHLKGLKIGVMGCIVNGPGEMADADYGYVGSGVGKITLYKEKKVVKKNIPEAEAVDALIELIKENNDWIDPPKFYQE